MLDSQPVLIGIVICGSVLLLIAGLVLLKLIVYGVAIVRAARTPPHHDAGDYRIEQGREVRSEERAPPEH